MALLIEMTLSTGALYVGNGYYRSAYGPSYLKTYLSAADNMTVTHYGCAVDCSRLGRNILNPKP